MKILTWLHSLLSPAPTCRECLVRLVSRKHAEIAGWFVSRGRDGVESWVCSKCHKPRTRIRMVPK